MLGHIKTHNSTLILTAPSITKQVHLTDRYWRPGPYSNMAVHMRYHQGFLLLQEMMDSAILRLQYWTNNPQDAESVPRAKRQATATSVSDEERDMLLNLPVYTKQQPYPCYEKDELVLLSLV